MIPEIPVFKVQGGVINKATVLSGFEIFTSMSTGTVSFTAVHNTRIL